MFFVLSKILGPLMQPLTYIVLLLLIALLGHRRRRLSQICIALALCFLFVFATYPLPDFLTRRLEQHYVRPEPVPQVDAIVMLTGIVNLFTSTADDVEFGDGGERIFKAIKLFQDGYADYLILTGGSGDLHFQENRESVILKQFAIDFGIPADRILIDPNSRNTYENAVETRKIIEHYNISSFLLITSASHMVRSMGCFQKLGLSPIPYPVDFRTNPHPDYRLSTMIPDVGPLRQTSAILHEYVGILAYKWAGYM